MNMNILAVDVNHMSTYDFLKDGETEEELLTRAENYRQNEIATWDKNRTQYPCETFENYYTNALTQEYKIMTWDEFETLQKDYYVGQPLAETTEESFEDMLNVLPPLKWCTINGVEMFCISEMLTGAYTSQYAKCNEKYYTKIVDVTDKNTWINKYI